MPFGDLAFWAQIMYLGALVLVVGMLVWTTALFVSSRVGASVMTPVQPVVMSGGTCSPKPTDFTSGIACRRVASCSNSADAD